MTFHEFGEDTRPHIMLIHGGGNAWWNYLRQARVLAQHYHVILPTLDGHGGAYQTPYVSTERTADQLMDYIQRHCGGHLFALCGVSLGGQIVIELLARKPDLTEKAIVDGSLCYPQPMMARFCIASVWLFGWMLFSEWACPPSAEAYAQAVAHRDDLSPGDPGILSAGHAQNAAKNLIHHVPDLYGAIPRERKREKQPCPSHVLVRGKGDEVRQELPPVCSSGCFPPCRIYEAKGIRARLSVRLSAGGMAAHRTSFL